MKRILFLIVSLFLAVCCYDDSALWESIENQEQRIEKLEAQCAQMNQNIASLQSILEALQKNDFIKTIVPITENKVEVGYAITFSSGKVVTIYHGSDGEDGQKGSDGADGHTPVIGVRMDSDGIYYWTLDGEWLTDRQGNKIKAVGTDGDDGKNGDDGTDGKDGMTPRLKIVDGYWYVSYDDGKNWTKLDKATGADGDSFFRSVEETGDSVIFVLADGSEITIAKQKKIDILFENIDGSVGVIPGEQRSISYTVVNGSDKTIVKALGQNGWSAKVAATSASKGTIMVTAPLELTDDEIIVLVYDGDATTIMKTISFEEGVIICDVQSISAKGGGDVLSVPLSSNLAVSARSSVSWIKCGLVAVKSTVPYTLEMTIDRNYSDEERVGTVTVSDKSGRVIHTIGVIQSIYDAYESFVDLSGGGETANCYIVNKPGEYKFPIIKGNGEKGVILTGDTAYISGAAGAKIVWQEGDIVKTVGINKGFVVFETYTDLYDGNAVIAVTDNKDNILWSWHIWSTDYVLGANDITVYNHAKTRSYQMMPLALGEANNRALLYQFGRKDPFPHAPYKTATVGTLTRSIQNPDVFYTRSGSDWCSEGRSDWWDAGYTSYHSSSVVASVLKGGKTIYDPCPVGYRVPPDDAFTSFTKTGLNTDKENEINSPAPEWTEFVRNDNTYYFYTQNGSNTIRFKAFGGLNAGSGEFLTNIAYYYSAHPSQYATSRLLQFYAGVVHPLETGYSRALAGSIRPVRDRVESVDIYESTDYSMDGTMKYIQKHTEGTGIRILLVGDGFTDKDIKNGLYDRSMNQAAEYFFDIEPYKSFRNRFDVINMRVVSKTSMFDGAKRTAFESLIGPGTTITGNLTKAFEKARSAYGTIDDVLVIVVLNTTEYAGTCYMAGDKTSVAFCPMSEKKYYPFSTVIHHEAGGHGFANLADEYYYGGTISQSEKDAIVRSYQEYGWYENVDVTSDPQQIKWSSFLNHPLYSSSVGIYEGGEGYTYGVWRPTKESCMNGMYGDFNAPSRYAIYKRIMKRSGESCSLSDFIEYDEINRNASSSAFSGEHAIDPSHLPEHTHPVAVPLESLPY